MNYFERFSPALNERISSIQLSEKPITHGIQLQVILVSFIPTKLKSLWVLHSVAAAGLFYEDHKLKSSLKKIFRRSYSIATIQGDGFHENLVFVN